MLKRILFFIILVIIGFSLVLIASATEGAKWDFDHDIDDWILGGVAPGEFDIQDGALVMTGGDTWLLSPTRMENCIIDTDISYESGHSGVVFRANASGSTRHVVLIASGLVKYFKSPGYDTTVTEVHDFEVYVGDTYHLRIVVNDSSLKVYLDGELAIEKDIGKPVTGEDYIGCFQYSGSSLMEYLYVTEWSEEEANKTPEPTPEPTAEPVETEDIVVTESPKPTESVKDKDKDKDKNILLPSLIVLAILAAVVIFVIIKKKRS